MITNPHKVSEQLARSVPTHLKDVASLYGSQELVKNWGSLVALKWSYVNNMPELCKSVFPIVTQ